MNDVYVKSYNRKKLSRFSGFTESSVMKVLGQEKALWTESNLEASVFLYLNYLENVLKIESQPLSIVNFHPADGRAYTLDSAILHINEKGKKVVKYLEIKPWVKYQDQKFKYACVERALDSLGYEFEVFTDKDLPTKQVMFNLEQLKRSAIHVDPASHVLHTAVQLLPQTIEFSDAIKVFDALGIPSHCLHYMIFKQYFLCDLTTKISGSTVLTSNIELETCHE
jgi:hypothetical protein